METLTTIIQFIRPNMYMAELDIKDACYSISIHKTHQKFLNFEYKSVLFKFTVLPNSCTEGPKTFTKLLKPPLRLLRKLERVLLGSYFDWQDILDDLLTWDYSYSACSKNITWVNSSSIKVYIISMPRNWIFRLYYKLNKYHINSYPSKEAENCVTFW